MTSINRETHERNVAAIKTLCYIDNQALNNAQFVVRENRSYNRYIVTGLFSGGDYIGCECIYISLIPCDRHGNLIQSDKQHYAQRLMRVTECTVKHNPVWEYAQKWKIEGL